MPPAPRNLPSSARFCRVLPGPCFHLDRASSSLDIIHEKIRQGELPLWGSVLVDEQSAGRGQLRRGWASPPGNLYAAIRLPMDGAFAGSAAASVLGLMLAEALQSLYIPVKVKWPNDILAETSTILPEAGPWRKVGGILLEERGNALVAGIGFNLRSCPALDQMREGFAFPAGTLPCDPSLFSDISQFWARLSGALYSCCETWNDKLDAATGARNHEAFPAWLPLASKHLAFVGCRVRLKDVQPGLHVEGTLRGMNADGSLCLDVDENNTSGERHFVNGSLALC